MTFILYANPEPLLDVYSTSGQLVWFLQHQWVYLFTQQDHHEAYPCTPTWQLFFCFPSNSGSDSVTACKNSVSLFSYSMAFFSMHCLLPLHRISSPPPTQLFQGTVNTCLQQNSWACVVTVRRAFCATLRKPLPTAAQRGNYVLTNGIAQWHYDARFSSCFCSLWKKYANRLTMRFKDSNLEAKVLYIT